MEKTQHRAERIFNYRPEYKAISACQSQNAYSEPWKRLWLPNYKKASQFNMKS